jgi:AGZA family xanthine/uracil permease-like MFS transporter
MGGNAIAGLTLLGLGVMILLSALRVPGAILIGIIVTAAATWGCEQFGWVGREGWELSGEGLAATAGKAFEGFGMLWAELRTNWIHIITFTFILLFMDMFDTVGTLVGVSSRAGLMEDGRLPRANRALAADAGGTIVGSLLGSSTVTSYIESVTGVASGARTGLAALVTAACLLLAMLFQDAIAVIGGAVTCGGAAGGFHPMIAAALILVGSMMVRAVRGINWDDVTEALPAFLTMITMPFAYSISAGIAIGFISYAFGKLATGRVKECPVMVYVFAALFVVRYLIDPS